MIIRLKRTLITLLLSFSSSMLIAQNLSVPVCAFVPLKGVSWCNAGEITFYWAYCGVDQNGNSHGWTFVDAYLNMGDGNIVYYDDPGFGPTTYQYSIMGQVELSGYANFVDGNGNTTTSPIGWIDYGYGNGEPCSVYQNPPQPFVNSLTIDINNVNPYFTTENNNGQISFFNHTSVFPQNQDATFWSYQLNIDGITVHNGSGFPPSNTPFYQTSLLPNQYQVELIYTYTNRSDSCQGSFAKIVEVEPPIPCDSCTSFKPIQGKRYWISAWVKEDVFEQVKSYNNAKLEVAFVGSGQPSIQLTTSGNIIEEWQRIVGDFTIPVGTSDIEISLVNNGNAVAFFDDIRVHPFNASMKSYVYDPETLLLTAELDDNNYATFYEYDKEGKLIRIKKETSRGIMTIQESRSRTLKR